MDEIVIGREGMQLRLCKPKSISDAGVTYFQFLCELCGPEFLASTMAFDMVPSAIPSLFQEMAEKWRGWPGKLKADNLEHQLLLEADRDSTGHVYLHITMNRYFPTPEFEVKTTLVLECGELESLAQKIAKFFPRTAV